MAPKTKSSNPFVELAALPVREIFDGGIRGHYAHLERMTVGEVELKPDTLVPMHNHPHEQITYMIEGRFEFTVGDQTRVLKPGDAVLIPANVMHGGKTITACRVIDIFAPVREDYR